MPKLKEDTSHMAALLQRNMGIQKKPKPLRESLIYLVVPAQGGFVIAEATDPGVAQEICDKTPGAIVVKYDPSKMKFNRTT